MRNSEFTRRTVLRSGLLAGAGAATVIGSSMALAGSAQAATAPVPSAASSAATAPEQFHWTWCNQCQGMFYSGGNNHGWCSDDFDGEPHANTSSYTSYNYGFYYDAEANDVWQDNWFWCSNCSGMFWSKDGETSYGACPATAGTTQHDGSNSYKSYAAYYGDLPSGFQDGWLWCSQCSGMFYGGNGSSYSYFSGICPINGGGSPSGGYTYHNGDSSYSYCIPWSGSISL
jgi:hypothetical protein